MIIDFHTHAFPEKIAARTLEVLRKGSMNVSGIDCTPSTDGTAGGLVMELDRSGVDMAVVLPIATKPEQTETINRVAAAMHEQSKGRLISFGSLHPSAENAPDEVDRAVMMGIRGIKLHPEFQMTDIDSPSSIAVLHRAAKNKIPVVIHAGRDIGLPPPVHSAPDMILRALDAVPDLTLVAAHLGGWMMWDEVANKLCGAPLYFDTAFISSYIEPSLARDIIHAHGAKKVLFGSDCPWESPRVTLAFLQSLDLCEEEKRDIDGENAKKILKIS
jgi:predicted TIM-barrel fold metal-dependent hydrolase